MKPEDELLETVLKRVAAGDLTPEEALSRLNSHPAGGSRRPETGPTTGIRLKTSYRSVRLVADPTVAQIHVTGEHSVTQEGSLLVVTTPGPIEDDERDPGAGRFSFTNLPRTIAWARSWRDHQLTARVNPAFTVDLDLTGSDVRLTGFEAGLRARLAASALRADHLHGELNISAFSSSLKLNVRPAGESRVYCESSSARITLAEGSDLRVTTSNRMGRISLPENPTGERGFEGENGGLTIGAGRDRLAVEAVMSSVTISPAAWAGAPAR
jgi:hypothetical protein